MHLPFLTYNFLICRNIGNIFKRKLVSGLSSAIFVINNFRVSWMIFKISDYRLASFVFRLIASVCYTVNKMYSLGKSTCYCHTVTNDNGSSVVIANDKNRRGYRVTRRPHKKARCVDMFLLLRSYWYISGVGGWEMRAIYQNFSSKYQLQSSLQIRFVQRKIISSYRICQSF